MPLIYWDSTTPIGVPSDKDKFEKCYNISRTWLEHDIWKKLQPGKSCEKLPHNPSKETNLLENEKWEVEV